MLRPFGSTPILTTSATKLPKRLGGHLVARPVRAIDDDAEPAELQVLRQRALGELDISAPARFPRASPADPVGGGQKFIRVAVDERLDWRSMSSESL